jgi:hypothetical protein
MDLEKEGPLFVESDLESNEDYIKSGYSELLE